MDAMHARTIAWLAAALLIAVAFACGSGSDAGPQGVTVKTQAASPAPPAGVAGETEAVTPRPTREPRLVSLAWLTTEVTLLDLPAAFAAPVADAALRARVESALTGAEGSYSVVVHNLEDGRYAAVNESQVYYAASLFKLSILLEVYKQREALELDFAQLLTLDEEHTQNDLGTLALLDLQPGDSLTLQDAVNAMIVMSDTSAATLLQDLVGAARADETLRSLGLTDTEFNNRALPTTARDMARLLEAVAAGEGVSDAARREMLSLLLQEEFRQGIPAGVPEGTAVAHKTGSFDEATHDVALVWGPGGPYVIVVMTDRPQTWERIAAVSAAVWDYFGQNP